LLARCRFSPAASVRKFREAFKAIPTFVGRHGVGSGCSADEAAHVITLWYMTASYLDPRGRPIALPRSGPAPSLEDLTHQTSAHLKVDDVLKYLNSAKALKRRGDLYVPRRRFVRHQSDTRFQNAHSLRAVTGLLRTVERNARGPNKWVEGIADGMVPDGKVLAALTEFSSAGTKMLEYADTFMLRQSSEAKDNRRNVPISLGIYAFDGRPLAPIKSPWKRPSRAPLLPKAAATRRVRKEIGLEAQSTANQSKQKAHRRDSRDPSSV
jgi:hypothetical protein